MAGGVDEVDGVALAVAVPGTGGGGGVDGDAPLLLFLVKVHDGGAFVDFTHLVNLAGVIENALGDSCLTSVDMSGNADVADFGEVASHNSPSPIFGKTISKVRWGRG